MTADFNLSKTKGNLMRAFSGECQARMRYAFAKEKADAAKLFVIGAVFEFTGAQEKEHAGIFLNHLRDTEGQNISIDGAYPVTETDSVIKLLESAYHNETEEADRVYRAFGDTAHEEGFDSVAASFYKIAEIEKSHAERFLLFSELMKKNRLFISDISCEWMCLNCGHIFSGTEAPEECPVCRHDKGFFIRLTLAPYTGKI